jgi:hypothetical protein
VLDSFKEENVALLQLQRLSTFEASDAHSASSASFTPSTSNAGGLGTPTEFVPRVSWAKRWWKSRRIHVRRRGECCDSGQVFAIKSIEVRSTFSAILSIKVAFYRGALARTAIQARTEREMGSTWE